ncbi:hypothetical protein ACFL15_00185 [Patescibacteria group bacterium]
MSTITKVVVEVVKKFGELGIALADVSVYPATRAFKERPFDVVIVAGYLPGKACLMTCDINVHRGKETSGDCKFTIDGEATSHRAYKSTIKPIGRSPVGSEMLSGGVGFSINDYSAYKRRPQEVTLMEEIDECFKFFQEFIKKARSVLKDKFSSSTHLWYVPEYSDVLLDLEKDNGKHSSRNYEPFNSSVLMKLPKEIFVEEQTA